MTYDDQTDDTQKDEEQDAENSGDDNYTVDPWQKPCTANVSPTESPSYQTPDLTMREGDNSTDGTVPVPETSDTSSSQSNDSGVDVCI